MFYTITTQFPEITANVVRWLSPLDSRVLSTISGQHNLFQNHFTPNEVVSFLTTTDVTMATFKAMELGTEISQIVL
jgi:hypothetical protein